jgi:hypothetical protein
LRPRASAEMRNILHNCRHGFAKEDIIFVVPVGVLELVHMYVSQKAKGKRSTLSRR